MRAHVVCASAGRIAAVRRGGEFERETGGVTAARADLDRRFGGPDPVVHSSGAVLAVYRVARGVFRSVVDRGVCVRCARESMHVSTLEYGNVLPQFSWMGKSDGWED